MIPELSILRLCCTHKHWCAVTNLLATDDLPRELQSIYRTLNSFHTNNELAIDLTINDLANLFFATRPKDTEYYQKVFEQLDKADASEATTFKLIDSIQTGKLLRELSIASYDCAEGRGDLEKVKALTEALAASQTREKDNDNPTDYEFVTDDLDVLVSDTIQKHGLRWRLNTLNRMLGSLRIGDFGFLFARPETGKTTFLASEVTFMAEQIPEGGGPILWLNNEEGGKKVMLRCYQASLGLGLTDLFRNLDVHKKAYHEKTHGNIRIYDSGQIHRKSVERMCKQLKPSLIIFDQIDKITGFDSDREDLRLGAIYQWARELAKSYAPVIGVCQADGSGEGQKWLTMSNVANAKTSKQAEADWILGIGKQNEVGYDQLRYLHTSKNKLFGDSDSVPDLRHGRVECLIDADKARYVDL